MTVERKATLYLILLSMIWGGTYLLIKIADQSMTPLTFSAGRMVIGAVFLYLFLRTQGHVLPPVGSVWITFCVLGIFGLLLPVMLIAYGEESVSSGFAAVLLSTVPIMTVVLAHFAAVERMTTEKLVGVVIGLVGATIVVWPSLAGDVAVGTLGVVFLLIVAVLRASTTVHAHKALEGVTPMVMATGMAIVAAVAATFVALVFENPLEWKPTAEGVLVMVLSGLLSSAAGYSLYYWLVAARGATYASLVSATRPVVAVLLSALVAGAAIEASTVVGLVVLVLCIVVMSGYLRKGTAILRRSLGSRGQSEYGDSG